jgi:hypothetical protein
MSDSAEAVERILGCAQGPKKTKSLVQLADDGLLKQLSKDLDAGDPRVRYCCGGTIPISHLPDLDQDVAMSQATSISTQMTSWPVELFFQDIEDCDSFKRIRFPNISGKAKMDALLSACSSYERLHTPSQAFKLESGQFVLDFHPVDFGIIDDISQIMVPGLTSKFFPCSDGCLGVRAELLCLEVREISRFFHSNIDREGEQINFDSSELIPLKKAEKADDPFEEHFGYLIVCLPSLFQGTAGFYKQSYI